MEQRVEFIVRALSRDLSFSALCQAYGISRPTGYRWLRRYRAVGTLMGVRELSRRPHVSPYRTDPDREARVVALRKAEGWGGKKIAHILGQEGVRLSVSTVNRIIKRYGLVEPEERSRSALTRFERPRPNELWQMDFKGDLPRRAGRCFPLSLLDDHSRYAVGLFALARPNGAAVHRCLVRTFEAFGVPEGLLLDHGSPWWSTTNGHGLTWLAVDLMKQGVRLHWSGFRHPQTQGKVERFHRTLAESIRHHGPRQTLKGWQQAFDRFRSVYNDVRPHEALAMAVPAAHYRPSRRAYNPNPAEWEYPIGAHVRRLNTQGCIDLAARRYFVCEALAGERVQVEYLERKAVIRYRQLLIREIDLDTGRTQPLLLTDPPTQL